MQLEAFTFVATRPLVRIAKAVCKPCLSLFIQLSHSYPHLFFQPFIPLLTLLFIHWLTASFTNAYIYWVPSVYQALCQPLRNQSEYTPSHQVNLPCSHSILYPVNKLDPSMASPVWCWKTGPAIYLLPENLPCLKLSCGSVVAYKIRPSTQVISTVTPTHAYLHVELLGFTVSTMFFPAFPYALPSVWNVLQPRGLPCAAYNHWCPERLPWSG